MTELLIGLGLYFALCVWIFRWVNRLGPRFSLKKELMDDAPIHAAIHRPVSLQGKATKGFKAGFTKDDAVVERKHLERVVRLGDRRAR